MQVEFRSHFSGEKVRLISQEIWYIAIFVNSNYEEMSYALNKALLETNTENLKDSTRRDWSSPYDIKTIFALVT
jgi:hypothetical protein